MYSVPRLAELARRFGEIDFSIKQSPYPQLPLEIALVEATAAGAAAMRPEPATEDAPERDAPSSRQPTSLRERVRGAASIREAPPSAPPHTSRPEPAPITPLRPEPAPEAPVARATGQVSDEVERIADLWPNVRADVKALNRRIEALLSEVDPVAVSGNRITLAVPYPFHRDKLNSDEVRETVASVLSRLLDREVSIDCILRGEMNPQDPASLAPPQAAPGSTEVESRETDPALEHERVQARITAAKNIFDAEEIEDDAAAAQPAPSRSG
jgi:hypothetical protein